MYVLLVLFDKFINRCFDGGRNGFDAADHDQVVCDRRRMK